MNVSVLGGGFVGATTAAVLAEQGHDVTLVEIDAARSASLAVGRAPFYEPGLDDALTQQLHSDRLHVTDSLDAGRSGEVVFLCVGTPPLDDGSADLSQMEAAVQAIADGGWPGTIVVKSTVPPGTTAGLVTEMLAAAGLAPAAMNPEFLQEGAALEGARDPSRVVLGVAAGEAGARAERSLRSLFKGADGPVLVVDPTTAEMIKYASNAMLATRVAMANEVGNLCEAVGIDVDEVVRGVGLDPRIGPHFLRAGIGFGGSCFPKDLRALRAVGRSHGVATCVLDAVLHQNDQQPLRAVSLLRDALGDLAGRRVALLGLAFKPGTSDVRETRALPIHAALVAQGATAVCHDPRANEAFDALVGGATLADEPTAALEGADGCIVVTEWPSFRDIDPAAFRGKVVVDGRRHLDGETLRAAGAVYLAVGDGTGSTLAPVVSRGALP